MKNDSIVRPRLPNRSVKLFDMQGNKHSLIDRPRSKHTIMLRTHTKNHSSLVEVRSTVGQAKPPHFNELVPNGKNGLPTIMKSQKR